jgi:SAM-dependent methyltransferase
MDVLTSNNADKTSDEGHKQERVKARWAILRRALLDASTDESASTDETDKNHDAYSMNSFPGFRVLNRTEVNDKSNKYFSYTATDDDGEWHVIRNSYSTNNQTIQFYTREVKKQSPQRKREALFSHRQHGVDNTGNVRVWDAEATLAGFLLDILLDESDVEHTIEIYSKLEVANLSSLKNNLRMTLLNNNSKTKTCNILELGAGQAGLAGLSLLAASCSSGDSKISNLHLTLSDGHPNCVKSNAVCARMMSENTQDHSFAVDTQLLLWDSSQKGFDCCQPMQESIDLCLANDCVHFQEHHDGLFMTISRTLKVHGIALLCQPKRGQSLENFMSLIDVVNNCSPGGTDPLFQALFFEDFHPKVSTMHNVLLTDANASSYNPNWHRPLLLCLKKLRHYDEAVDGRLARQHVQTYNSPKEKFVAKESSRLAPYNPTHSTAQNKALELLNLQRSDVLFDLGCGDGRLLVLALETALEKESKEPSCAEAIGLRCVGIEYDHTLSETAKANMQQVFTRINSEKSSERACIRWDDVLNEKERVGAESVTKATEQLTLLNDSTAVFVYLLPDGLRKIKPLLVEAAKRRRHQRCENQLTPPFRVVSYMFSIPGWKPVLVDNSSKGGCALHYYEDVDLLESKA